MPQPAPNRTALHDDAAASAALAGLPPRERLLAVGERMFARHGLSAVSIRALTRAADVNLAALHYHFGSKERLLEEIFETRARPIVEERERALARCVEAPGRPPLLEQILEAFLRASLALDDGDREGRRIFVKLRARLASEPEDLARRLLATAFDRSSRMYMDALARALPGLPEEDLRWRFHFLLGTMVYTMADAGRIQALTEGRCDPGDGECALAYMVPFLAAGFRAPSGGARPVPARIPAA